MGYNPSSVPTCPRCGTPFPLTERACRNCGLTQEVAQDPSWRSAAASPVSGAPQDNTYNAQQPYGQPAPAPSRDPFEHARRGQSYQDYPPPSYADYAPPPPKRSFWRSAGGISLVIFLLLMVVGVSAFGIYYYPQLCSAQQRNDLRVDIPLPCGITFLDHLDRSASGTTGPGSAEWVYSVDGQSPAQITSFYQDRLTHNGWTLPSTIQDPADNELAACQNPTVALINSTQKPHQEGALTFNPPSGGSLLLIILAPEKNLVSQIQLACGTT
jgi:hypothetical protein